LLQEKIQKTRDNSDELQPCRRTPRNPGRLELEELSKLKDEGFNMSST